jgi:hypothetical protein
MARRQTLLAKLHREIAALKQRSAGQQRQIKDLERIAADKPPALSPLAQSVAVAVRKIDPERRVYDHWVASVNFSPDAWARGILYEQHSPINLSYVAAEVAHRIEYDVREAIIKAVSKAQGFGR